jgi:L-ascorbate metabolism protein UlaG (beta-lactamase superfamily)
VAAETSVRSAQCCSATTITTAADAIELVGLIRPRVAIPIHYEGWMHFQEGRDVVERELSKAPQDIRERFQ